MKFRTEAGRDLGVNERHPIKRMGSIVLSEDELKRMTESARAYESLFIPAMFGHWASKVAGMAGLAPGERVLDVACETGVLARAASGLVGETGQVTGLDLNPGMLTVARELAPEVVWAQGDACALPFEDEAFDVVMSNFGLMFFPDRQAAIREMLRVLRPGGRLLVAVWDTLANTPAYAAEVATLERLAGRRAADALSAPFVLGDLSILNDLFALADKLEITTHSGSVRFPSIAVMVEADLRGWLPVMGVHLEESQIQTILNEAEKVLQTYLQPDGTIEFDSPAHIVLAHKST